MIQSCTMKNLVFFYWKFNKYQNNYNQIRTYKDGFHPQSFLADDEYYILFKNPLLIIKLSVIMKK